MTKKPTFSLQRESVGSEGAKEPKNERAREPENVGVETVREYKEGESTESERAQIVRVREAERRANGFWTSQIQLYTRWLKKLIFLPPQ